MLLLACASVADTVLRRTTLVVHDLERSIEFYETLGLDRFYQSSRTVAEDSSVIGGADLPLSGSPGASEIVILIGPDADTGMIGLLSYTDPPLAPVRDNIDGIGRGDVILMFVVDDLHGVFEKLEKFGTRMHSAPYRYEVTDNDGQRVSSGWRMFVYDPDGHLIEVSEPSEREPG